MFNNISKVLLQLGHLYNTRPFVRVPYKDNCTSRKVHIPFHWLLTSISCPRILKFRAKNVLVVSYRQPILYFESFEELAGSRDWWFSLKDVPQVNSYSHASRQPRGVVKHKQVFLESIACVRSFRSLAVVCHQNKLKETGRGRGFCMLGHFSVLQVQVTRSTGRNALCRKALCWKALFTRGLIQIDDVSNVTLSVRLPK